MIKFATKTKIVTAANILNTQQNQTTMQKTPQKTFVEIYRELPEKAPLAPKTAFIKEIAKLCKVNDHAVRMWLNGSRRPDELKRSIIAKKLNVPEKILFPEKS